MPSACPVRLPVDGIPRGHLSCPSGNCEVFKSSFRGRELLYPGPFGEIKNIPLGAIGIYSYAGKLLVGLQQLTAGSRNFSVSSISRDDLLSLTEDCAKVTGIPYLLDHSPDEAMKILNS